MALYLFPSRSSVEDAKQECLETCTSKSASPEILSIPFPPRTSSRDACNASSLDGLAVHVTPRPGKSLLVEPAGKHVKHSLFRDPLEDASLPNDQACQLPPIQDEPAEEPTEAATDRITVLPERRPSQRAPMPGLPLRTTSLQRRKAQHRRSSASEITSLRSASPTLVRSNSGANARPPFPPQSIPMQSIFPRYEPDLPLAQQPYYPRPTIATLQHVRKVSSSPKSFAIPAETRLSLPSTPKQGLPLVADENDLVQLWEAANGNKADMRIGKIQMHMRREGKPTVDLSFGSTSGATLYTAVIPTMGTKDDETGEVIVKRQHPSEECPLPVAQVDCKAPRHTQDDSDSIYETSQHISSIFPQAAALDALKVAANSLQASTIAQFDPRASSPQAAQLAFNAVDEAKENEECELDFRPQLLDTSSTGTYNLHHPRLGDFTITVQGRVNIKDTSSHRCSRLTTSNNKLTLHHPCVTGSTSSKPLPGLASLDLNSDILELDLAALQNLDSRYFIDTVVCAIVAVVACESSRYVDENVFDGPPATTRCNDVKDQSSPSRSTNCSVSPKKPPQETRAKKSRAFWRRPKKAVHIEKETQKKLPALTRGVLRLLGFSFDAVVWLLSLGVKVLTKLVVCISGAVEKA